MENKCNKNGFSLVEMLATLIILSLLALIVTPRINDVLNVSGKMAFKETINNILESASNYLNARKTVKYNGIIEYPIIFICNGNECKNNFDEKLEFERSVPVSGKIIVLSDGTYASMLTNGKLCAHGEKESFEIASKCNVLDHSDPVVDDSKEITLSSTTNSITVSVPNNLMSDDETGIARYDVSVYEGNTKVDEKVYTEPNIIFTNLKSNTEYRVVVAGVNGNELASTVERIISTYAIINPTISYQNTPSEAVNGYFKNQTLKITYNNSNITSPSYFIKSTRDASVSSSTVASCGTDTNPGACTIENIINITAGTWYRVSGNVDVLYNTTAAEVATIYAITNDGNNFSGATTKTVSKIDATKPTITLGTITTKTNSISINYVLDDSNSNVSSYTCKYSTTNGSYTINGTSITSTNCTISNISNDSIYYYQICATDGVGNSNCVTDHEQPPVITSPTIMYHNTPEIPINGYLTSQTLDIIYSDVNVDNATYYVKTTRDGVASIGTIESCGTGTNPGNCVPEVVTNLDAGLWYRVSGNVSVTYNQNAAEEATLIATTYDGVNFSAATSKVVSKIDNEKPTITFGNVNKTTNSAIINYTLYDAKSGVESYTCKYSTTDGSYTINGDSVTSSACTITGMVTGTTYYYQVCVIDKLGNAGDCETGSVMPHEITRPTIVYTNNPNETRDYYISQTLGVTFYNTNITSPTYYIKSGRAATTNSNVVANCGIDTKPGECSNNATTSIVADTWYKVSGNINVVYNVDSSTTSTLVAMTYDGLNYNDSTSKTVAKIENTTPTAPVIAGGTSNCTHTSRTISVSTAGSAFTNVARYQYYVSTSNSGQSGGSWANVTNTSVTVSTAGTHYVYFRTVSNGGYTSGASNAQTVYVDTTNYTISYTMNSGSASGNPTSYYCDSSFTLNNPTRTGYSFAGWSGTGLSGSGNKSVSVGVNNTGNRSYTANWTSNTYTVTFDKRSGSGGTNSVTATYDSAMPSATAPTQGGYAFGGYYTSTNGGGTQYYNSSMGSVRNWNIASATTLYAKWDGCGAGKYSNSNSCTNCAKNTYSTGSANASCTSCPTGYQTSGTGSDEKADCKITCSANTRVASKDAQCTGCGTGYSIASHTVSAGNTSGACSANTFTVKYNGNNNTGGSTAQHNCTYDSNCAAATNGFTRTNYVFAGWKRENTGSIIAAGASIKNTVASGTVTYYAQWTEAAAKIGSTYYTTVQGAINAAGNNTTVTVLKNVTENLSIPSGKTIDISNAKTITGCISNSGTLSLYGGGTINCYGSDAINNSGTVTVSSQTVSNTKPDATGIYNIGTLRLTSTTVSSAGNGIILNTNGNAIIANGSVISSSSTSYAILLWGNSNLTVNGSTIIKNTTAGKAGINNTTSNWVYLDGNANIQNNSTIAGKIMWIEKATSNFTVRYCPSQALSSARIYIWSDANGQDDLKNYDVTGTTVLGSTCFVKTVNYSDHTNSTGKYNVHIYNNCTGSSASFAMQFTR